MLLKKSCHGTKHKKEEVLASLELRLQGSTTSNFRGKSSGINQIERKKRKETGNFAVKFYLFNQHLITLAI